MSAASNQRNGRVIVANAAGVDVRNPQAHAPEANRRDLRAQPT
jgi:hypothetical protein